MRGVIADTGPLYATYDKSDSFHPIAQPTLQILQACKIKPVKFCAGSILYKGM